MDSGDPPVPRTIVPKTLACLLLISALTFLPACGGGGGGGGDDGGGGGGTDPFLINVSDCAGEALEVADGLLAAMTRVIDEVNGNDAPDTTYQAPFIVTAGADFDGDGFNEGSLSGSVASSFELADGFGVNEALTVRWNIDSGAAGEGEFEFFRDSATTMGVSGFAIIEAIDSCDFSITGLTLMIDNTARLETATGNMQISGDDGSGNSISGTLTIPTPGTAIFVGQFNGVDVSFDIDLTTFVVTLN